MEKLDVVFMSQNLGIGLKTLISNILGTTGIEFPAHRIILAQQSPLLHNVLLEYPGTDL